MGQISNLSRRAFAFGSAAVAGGVAFGSYGRAQQAASPPAATNPLAAGLGPNSVTFNPWVEISPEKITLIAQHADIGQGVGSVQPIMIAEEMDVDPGQFEIRFAGPSPAYFNTGFADELAPFMAADQSPAAETARAAALEWLRKSGLQMTGGSSTIPDTYEKLRMAGAIARETLKAAAAKRCGVAVADMRTEGGNVILPDGTKIPYVTLSADAANIPPVLDVKLRDPSQWRLIGKPMMRLDIRSKVTGEMKFGIDQKMDGMVYASVKLNPNKGQPMKSYDASKAQSMPGVQKILKVSNGVAVIATNSWYAMKAAELVDCKWAPAEYPAEQADHWKTVGASFVPEFLGKEWRNDRRYRSWIEGGHARRGRVSRALCRPSAARAAQRDRHRHRRRDGNLGWSSEPAIRAVHRGDGDRHQAGTGDVPQPVDRWELWAPSRIRERPGVGRDRKPDARHADQADVLARGGFSPGHSAADCDRPARGSVENGKIVAADLQLASNGSAQGAAWNVWARLKRSRCPIGRRYMERLLRHPEFPGHELRGAGTVALHHMAFGRRLDGRLLHRELHRRIDPCAPGSIR